MTFIISSNIFSICWPVRRQEDLSGIDSADAMETLRFMTTTLFVLIPLCSFWFMSRFLFSPGQPQQCPTFPEIHHYPCSSQLSKARSMCGRFDAPTHSVAGARATSGRFSCQLLLRGFLFTQPACLCTSSTVPTSSLHCPPALLT